MRSFYKNRDEIFFDFRKRSDIKKEYAANVKKFLEEFKAKNR